MYYCFPALLLETVFAHIAQLTMKPYSNFMIYCQNLSKSYGPYQALNALNLKVEPGQIFGFLGPNGAGKTTTIRLLTGMLRATEGQASIFGLDCQKQRAEIMRRIGYLPDRPLFHDYLRAREILEFLGRIHGLSPKQRQDRIKYLLAVHGLTEDAEEFANNFSLGMKKKLALACAQLHDPELYILDEPVAGLDPLAARAIQFWILEMARTGKTVFLSTHQLSMAQKLCHRVGIIQNGQLEAEGDFKTLQTRLCPGGSLEDLFFAVTEAQIEPEPS